MSGPAGWAVSGSAVIIAGCCAVALHHLSHAGGGHPGTLAGRLYGSAHPHLHRFIAFWMLAAGSALALTPLGGIVVGIGMWADARAGGQWAPFVHALFVIGAFALLLAALTGFVRAPSATVAWTAFAFPFLAAVVGGHLHAILTALPFIQWCQQVAHWAGG